MKGKSHGHKSGSKKVRNYDPKNVGGGGGGKAPSISKKYKPAKGTGPNKGKV